MGTPCWRRVDTGFVSCAHHSTDRERCPHSYCQYLDCFCASGLSQRFGFTQQDFKDPTSGPNVVSINGCYTRSGTHVTGFTRIWKDLTRGVLLHAQRENLRVEDDNGVDPGLRFEEVAMPNICSKVVFLGGSCESRARRLDLRYTFTKPCECFPRAPPYCEWVDKSIAHNHIYAWNYMDFSLCNEYMTKPITRDSCFLNAYKKYNQRLELIGVYTA